MNVDVLIVEDHNILVEGLRDALAGSAPGSEEGVVRALERVLTTAEDAVAFFERASRRGGDALAALPVDVVLVDDRLPRDRHRGAPEQVGVELAIRITALYDRAGIDDARRPKLVLTTTTPDPTDVRAFIAYGGSDVVPKEHISPRELRAHLMEVAAGRRCWIPPVPSGLGREYTPGLAKYLRAIELGVGAAEAAARLGVVTENVAREKNRLRHALRLAERASDVAILKAAKAAGITWVPFRYSDLARDFGVKPRLPLW